MWCFATFSPVFFCQLNYFDFVWLKCAIISFDLMENLCFLAQNSIGQCEKVSTIARQHNDCLMGQSNIGRSTTNVSELERSVGKCRGNFEHLFTDDSVHRSGQFWIRYWSHGFNGILKCNFCLVEMYLMECSVEWMGRRMTTIFSWFLTICLALRGFCVKKGCFEHAHFFHVH